jgi:hypothetical protein
MALVRNLRNIIRDAPEVVYEACVMLLQPELVRKSRMLPFRFVTARDEIEKIEKAANPGPLWKAVSSVWSAFREGMTEGQSPRRENTVKAAEATRVVLQTLNKAADIALANVPRLEGKTLVVVDESGSMTWGKRPIEIASLFAAVLLKANAGADLMMFSNTVRYIAVNTDDTLLTIQRQIASRAVAGGTNFNAIFDSAGSGYDRIVILSDMQGWMGGGAPTGAFARYRTRTGADPHVYSFDLQGYGTLMFPERNVYALAGFSEKVFDVMPLLEQDREALVHEIEAVELA